VDALIAEFPRFVGGFFGTLRISLIAAVVALVLGTLLGDVLGRLVTPGRR
jgi:ABC-type sulfate transport system permease component